MTTDSLLFWIQMSNTIHHYVENYMTILILSQLSSTLHTILAINCVHASNWFTHLQRTQQIDGQNDNSVFTV